MNFFRPIVFVLLFLLPALSMAQPSRRFGMENTRYVVKGHVKDEKDKSRLTGVNIVIFRKGETKPSGSTQTDSIGRFAIALPDKGPWQIQLMFLGYSRKTLELSLDRIETFLEIPLERSSAQLKEIEVTGVQKRVEQKGDTTIYNADAYKVNVDASTEDLIAKMPGITIENGVVKAQGEEVKRVTVDGKEFFGDDVSMALRNLPAEVVDRVQVFDRWSDQAMFTGFDDGNAQKTINITTKRGKANGMFGRFSLGYGTDDRYSASANFNVFNGDRRLTVITQSNNINQQNFNFQDILGMFGGGGGMGGNMGRMMMSGMGGGGGRRMMGMGGGGGGMGGIDPSTFFIGQRNGISTTHALGLNFNDQWGSKLKVSGSYFVNYGDNDQIATNFRQFITESNLDSALTYRENTNQNSLNLNHRANFRFEYTIDTNQSIIFTPRFNIQDSKMDQLVSGVNSLLTGTRPISITENLNSSLSTGFRLGQDFLYRRRLGKPGRTFSINLNTEWNNRWGNTGLVSTNAFGPNSDFINSFNQDGNNNQNGLTIGTTLTYTEPVGKNGQLSLSYNPSHTLNHSERSIFNLPGNMRPPGLDTSLSSLLDNTYTAHRGTAAYRLNAGKVSIMAGITTQWAQLEAGQLFPVSFNISQPFFNILPNAQMQWKIANGRNLRVNYRTSTNVPSVTQLQPVIDNSNPLLLSMGNPDLRQDFSHNLSARYSHTMAESGRSFFVFAMASLTQDYVGNQTFIPGTDSTTVMGVKLRPGAQLSRPTNLDGFISSRLFMTYGFPVKFLKSNLNLNTGVTFQRTPGLINDDKNLADNLAANAGFFLGSNISEKIDFSVGYNFAYNNVTNSLRPQSNYNFSNHTLNIRGNWQFWKGLFLNLTSVTTLNNGLTDGFNQNFTLMSASLGYKMLKNKALELKLSVFDALQQNTAVSRNVTETYVEDQTSNVLTTYYMFTVSYNIRKFKTEGMGGGMPMMRFGF